MSNPNGLMIQAQSRHFNRAALFDHVRKARYTTLSVLDDQQLAIDLATELHVPYAVFREFPFMPLPKDNPVQAARAAYAHIQDKVNMHINGRNAFYMVNCEHGFSRGHCQMWAEMIRLSANDPGGPIGLVVGNTASGSIKCGQGNEPNQWESEGEILLKMLHYHRDVKLPNGSKAFILGDHYYTGIHPWIAVNGGEKRLNPRWEDRPLTMDWNKPQWHLGRGIQGIMQACKKWGIEPPPMIVTECLIDDMDDVAYTFGDRSKGDAGLKLAPGYKKARGWRSLIPQWAEWYGGSASLTTGGRDPAEVLADMHIWAWETIYKPLGFVIGTHTYCYGDGSLDQNLWTSFRVDEADGKAYRAKMEAYNAPVVVDPKPPVIPPEQQPKPEPPPKPEMTKLEAALTALKLVNETVREMKESLEAIYRLNQMVIEKIESGGT